MKLQRATYVCAQCGSRFPSGEIVGGYGTLLLRSEGAGRAGVVETSADPAFEEISQLTSQLPLAKDLSERKRGDLVRFAFGTTADRDADGSRYRTGAPPHCPVCGSSRIADWQMDEPPAFLEVDLPPVSHHRWDRLSDEEKLREVEAAARDFLSF